MKETLIKGTRIYYHGDVANRPGVGTITKAYTDRWGDWVDIKMDDGREFKRILVTLFSPVYKGNGWTPFVTLEAYKAFKDVAVKKLMETSPATDYLNNQLEKLEKTEKLEEKLRKHGRKVHGGYMMTVGDMLRALNGGKK